MIKNNQITPFSKTCDLETAFKEKQSKTDIRKVDLYLGWSLMTPFVAKWSNKITFKILTLAHNKLLHHAVFFKDFFI